MRVPDGHTESCALERIPYDQPGADHGSRCHGSTCHPAGARDSTCHEGMGESFILEPAQGFNCIHQAARSFIAKIWSTAPGLWPWWYVCAKSFQSCLTLCDPMDCSLPGSAIHGILQVRILEWVVMPSSRRSSQPRDQTNISYIPGRFFATEPQRKPQAYMYAVWK